jgi:hypothetical protein
LALGLADALDSPVPIIVSFPYWVHFQLTINNVVSVLMVEAPIVDDGELHNVRNVRESLDAIHHRSPHRRPPALRTNPATINSAALDTSTAPPQHTA